MIHILISITVSGFMFYCFTMWYCYMQQRHRSDNHVNNRLSWVLRDGKLVEELWYKVVVGDIIKMENDHFVAVLLSCCYCSTYWRKPDVTCLMYYDENASSLYVIIVYHAHLHWDVIMTVGLDKCIQWIKLHLFTVRIRGIINCLDQSNVVWTFKTDSMETYGQLVGSCIRAFQWYWQ